LFQDVPTGIDYFKRALESNPENIPCLMDFIRYSYQEGRERSIPSLLAYLELHGDSLHRRPVLLKKTQFLKGSLLWRENRLEEALDCWIEALGHPQTAQEIPKASIVREFPFWKLDSTAM